ncbi:protein singed-like [Actinia tenebrosa]|uniref:Fascin n=1 Tax=Actinia tenebrosa TaxID=6105 RepID=A0A6P8I187_ACTTE|nr:protein singed-like [Actinia tenebrosa]
MPETTTWNIGLVNHASRYLTVETFGFTLNADGTSLRKKQMWVLEQDNDEGVYFKCHLGRYLTADPKGKLSCEATEREPNARFTIVTKDGKWALKSSHNAYFGATGDQLKCVAKIGKTELWTVHLAMHPQVNLKSVLRKRYAHLDEASQDIKVSEIIPWGADAMVTLEFTDGAYAIVASNDKYLKSNGDLSDELTDECKFSIEFHQKNIAFRDHKGKYLTAVGTGRLQCKKDTVTKDELYILEDSHPQCSFIGHNDRRISIKQSMDVTANQAEMTDTEIFQVIFNKENNKVSFLSNNEKYWLANGSVATASSSEITPKAEFELEWHGNQIAFKANSGKYLSAKANGQLLDGTDEVSATGLFTVELVNRPLLVLRGEFGFVGCKGTTNRLECNRAAYDVFRMKVENGFYTICNKKGKYWRTEEDGSISVSADETGADRFQIELRGRNGLCIKSPNGCYLKGEQNGTFNAKGTEVKDTVWEY